MTNSNIIFFLKKQTFSIINLHDLKLCMPPRLTIFNEHILASAFHVPKKFKGLFGGRREKKMEMRLQNF